MLLLKVKNIKNLFNYLTLKLIYFLKQALKSEKTDHENLKNILDSLATEYETKN